MLSFFFFDVWHQSPAFSRAFCWATMAARHALVRRRIYANLSSWGFLFSKFGIPSTFSLSGLYHRSVCQLDRSCAVRQPSSSPVGFPPFAHHRVRRLWGWKIRKLDEIAQLRPSDYKYHTNTICGLDVVYNGMHVMNSEVLSNSHCSQNLHLGDLEKWHEICHNVRLQNLQTNLTWPVVALLRLPIPGMAKNCKR